MKSMTKGITIASISLLAVLVAFAFVAYRATLDLGDQIVTVIIKQGDSFYVIARDQLGDANRWPELLQLNTELVKGDPKKLRPGQGLQVPE